MKAAGLIPQIRKAFLNRDNLAMEKYVPEFDLNGSFIGDFFNYFIFESTGKTAPRIYHIGGPFDIISKKAPQQALVYYEGNLELNIPFTEYVDMRTGVMDALILQELGVETLDDKKVIMYGSGKIARWSLTYLKEVYPDLESIDFVNAGGNTDDFVSFGDELGVSAKHVESPDLTKYDVIILHTNSEKAVLKADDVDKIKKGAIITSYRTTSPEGELDPSFLDSTKAQIVADWDDTLKFVVDMKRAREEGLYNDGDVLYLKEMFEHGYKDSKKAYTVFRSTGTPMQNVAVLKVLLREQCEK